MATASRRAQSCFILWLILNLHLVASQRSDDKETAEGPPQQSYSSLDSCYDQKLLDPLTCTGAAPPQDDGDQKVTRREAVPLLLTLLASRKGEGTKWEIIFFLIFPSALGVFLFCDISIRNMYPRLADALEKVAAVSLVNGVVAFLLPADCFWVPLLCFSLSLLTLIITHFLP